MKVVEIFDSIQGEGVHMGSPCTFIRLAGCPVKCSWCDSKDSWYNGKDITIKDIVAKVNWRMVVITGGEPLMQKDVVDLVHALHEKKCEVHLETSGCYDIPEDVFDWVTVSPKPNTGYRLPKGPINELKYVVSDELSTTDIADFPIVWLQPCDGPDYKWSLQECIALAMQGYGRCGVQLHKVYGVA